jgi:hypothetical protein
VDEEVVEDKGRITQQDKGVHHIVSFDWQASRI